MSDDTSSLDDLDLSELSEEDLAIVQAFEAMDTWQAQGPLPSQADGEAEKPLESISSAHTSIFCFLVQAGDQQFLLPLKHIQRISYGHHEGVDVRYSLQDLLGFSGAEPQESTSQYLLLLSSEDGTIGGRTTGIAVDEILEEQEHIVEPLADYLQRSGIAGVTIDGNGRVLLVVDPLQLIRSIPQRIT